MTEMNLIRLCNGNKIPAIGMGTYKLSQREPLTELLENALKIGYRLIDSAICYRNESFIGDFLVSDEFKQLGVSRNDLFITSKIPPNLQGTQPCSEAVHNSLKNLRLDCIDLMLIHWPGASRLKPESEDHSILRKQTYEQLERMQEQGLIRNIGVSNYTVNHLKELLNHCRIKPTVNQVEFHPHLLQQELLEFCCENEILLQAYSPLGSDEGVKELLGNPVVKSIASQLDRKPAQVLLRWSLQHGCCVLPKTANVGRLSENFQVFDFKLSKEQMERLNGLNRDHHYCWDPTIIY